MQTVIDETLQKLAAREASLALKPGIARSATEVRSTRTDDILLCRRQQSGIRKRARARALW